MAIEINPSTPSSPIPTVNGISVIWLGNWDNARVYRRNEGVFYDGSSYRANITTTEEPTPTATDWDLLALGTDVDTTTVINNHIANTSNPHSTTAVQVGAIPTSEKGIASGVATLNSGGKIPDAQIPDAIARDSELTAHTSNTSNPHSVTASQVGNTTAQWNADKIKGVVVDDSAKANGRVLKYNSGTQVLEYVVDNEADLTNFYNKTETNTLLNTKANTSTTYSKSETDSLLTAKANQLTTYTKTETDGLLTAKANQLTTYTKTETDSLLTAKANSSTTYTKTETDSLLNTKANQSATYTKTEVDGLLNTKPDNLTELADVVITSPIDGQSLVYDDSSGKWVNETVSGGGGGGSGEFNTASNIGSSGVGIYKQKTGANLEFKKVNAGSTKISITDDTSNSEVDIDVNEANLTLGNLAGTLPVNKGGTGSTNATNALTALGAASSSDLISHTGNTSNPHSTTAAQVGNTTAQWNADKIQGINVHTATPTNGQVLVYNTANSRYEPATPSAGGGKIIQVVYSSVSSWVISTTGSWQSTGLAASITPTNASSTIYITGALTGVLKTSAQATQYFTVGIFDGTSNYGITSNVGRRADIYAEATPIILFVPAATTSARTYTVRCILTGTGNISTTTINYLTLMEIAP
jgi:hypothetical protein